MDKIYDPIYATDLLTRWKCSEEFLSVLNRQGELTAYHILELRVDSKSNTSIAFCESIPPGLFNLHIKEKYNNVVFPGNEVINCEAIYPEILCSQQECDNSEWIPADEARRILRLSPIQFVSMLNCGAVETNNEQGRRDYAATYGYPLGKDEVPYFKVSNLRNLHIFRSSFEEYLERPPISIGPYAVTDDMRRSYYLSKLGTESNGGVIAQQSNGLESKLAQAHQEIERLKSINTSVDCAECKAESQHSDEWAIDVECSVRLACSLMESGERGSTVYHEAEWKTLRGAIRKRAFEAFRRALPDHLKEADPKKK